MPAPSGPPSAPLGGIRDIPAVDRGGVVIKEVLRRAKIRQDKVDLVIMGNVLQAGEGQNSSRQAAMLEDISQYTPAININAVGGSGMEAMIAATQKILVRAAEIVVAGGMESMSRAPLGSLRPGGESAWDICRSWIP